MRSTEARAWTVDAIVWDEVGADGTKYALLEGRRDVPGVAFTYAFLVPAGFWDPPHWHTSDVRLVVLKGTLHLGYGDAHDPGATQGFGVGSYVLVPAGARHLDGSDEETVIIGTAAGPWATHYVDPSVVPSAGTDRDERG